ncbi:hypothetical protein E3N88_45382 [Mikania micrantha]|uniref:Uncharacterized protein n=1 Tax=Mikania micrantha TaxID=192012 RepID=A0A5N6LA00_9ASTR|nr:hypothetical protein E3N88_45382 [Mikania micrantha]
MEQDRNDLEVMIRSYTFGDGKDRWEWRAESSAEFSTKECREWIDDYKSLPSSNKSKFWCKWIPPKVDELRMWVIRPPGHSTPRPFGRAGCRGRPGWLYGGSSSALGCLDLLSFLVEDVEGYAWAKESLNLVEKRERYGREKVFNGGMCV